MPVVDPYQVIAAGLKALIDTEFTAEQYVAVHDHLHESLGADRTEIGISPLYTELMTGNAGVTKHWIKVQFYDLYEKRIDPTQAVSPLRITEYAERFRQAVRGQQAGYTGTPEVWYFDVVRIEYPHDPTGNKTRFEAQVCAYGENTGMYETG